MSAKKHTRGDAGPEPRGGDYLDAPALDTIKTIYLRVAVKGNGEIHLKAADLDDPVTAKSDSLKAELARLDDAFRKATAHKMNVRHGSIPPMTEGQAKAMAAVLEERLYRGEMHALFRPTRGGKRKFGLTAARAQHGLGDRDLARFAEVVDEATKGAKDPNILRRALAESFGIPREYGGRARDDALRRLVRKGRALGRGRDNQR